MLRNLKLGLSKLSKSEYINTFIRLHNDLASQILKSKEIDRDFEKEHKAEIKMFFWLISGDNKTRQINEEWKKTLDKLLLDYVIFDEFDEDIFDENCVWDKDDFKDIFEGREEFYNDHSFIIKPKKYKTNTEIQQRMKTHFVDLEQFNYNTFANAKIQGIYIDTTKVNLILGKGEHPDSFTYWENEFIKYILVTYRTKYTDGSTRKPCHSIIID